ncbi:unnamed protein product [Trichogramma brassicae]|uniref:Peptidoglycan recognition protein family domain-containing protein n=1 Tax=Trichogramma brassicae TaxID=86971 RepID=A0A6H5IIL5_9HYME|nr:unnamed protein product [Trichogramma brassicae]
MHLRNVQALNVQQSGLNDIAYNFLVGGDGLVYEGRGWGVAGQHTPGYDARSVAVAFIGDFEYRKPTEAQVQAARELIAHGVRLGKIAADYKLQAQRQVMANTKSPGKQVYDIVKGWEHFSL